MLAITGMALLCIDSPVGFAQEPGRWELIFQAKHWIPEAMAFSDSSFGVVLADSTNGQTSKNLGLFRIFEESNEYSLLSLPDTFVTYFYGMPSHGLSFPTRKDVYLTTLNGSGFISHDTGNSWSVAQLEKNGFVYGSRIFGNGVGFILYDNGNGASQVYETTDSAQTFLQLPHDELIPININDFVCIDTEEFWACTKNKIFQTTNKGFHWSSPNLLDTVSKPAGINYITEAEPDRLYLTFYNGLIWDHGSNLPDSLSMPDFAETTDDGITWRLDSSLGDARIYWLSSPAKNIVWAMVGSTDHGTSVLDDPGPDASYADSLFYSSDDGHTWFKDVTFVGDTLAQMCWPDSRHGYITAVRDSTLLVYRFLPNSSGVSLPEHPRSVDTIYPNPAVDRFTIRSNESNAYVHLLDILGRDVLSRIVPASGTLTLDVSHLPRGIYAVMAEVGGQMLPVGRIVLVGE